MHIKRWTRGPLHELWNIKKITTHKYVFGYGCVLRNKKSLLNRINKIARPFKEKYVGNDHIYITGISPENHILILSQDAIIGETFSEQQAETFGPISSDILTGFNHKVCNDVHQRMMRVAFKDMIIESELYKNGLYWKEINNNLQRNPGKEASCFGYFRRGLSHNDIV